MKKGISLKKVLIIICLVLCTGVSYGVQYATPYKGCGYARPVYARPTHHAHYAATMPSISMASTSAYATSTGAYATSSASSIVGTTASETYGNINKSSRPRRSNEYPGIPGCDHCVDANGDGVCDICECDKYDGCDCDPCHCDVPLSLDLTAVLFFALLSGLYAYRKYRRFPV